MVAADPQMRNLSYVERSLMAITIFVRWLTELYTERIEDNIDPTADLSLRQVVDATLEASKALSSLDRLKIYKASFVEIMRKILRPPVQNIDEKKRIILKSMEIDGYRSKVIHCLGFWNRYDDLKQYLKTLENSLNKARSAYSEFEQHHTGLYTDLSRHVSSSSNQVITVRNRRREIKKEAVATISKFVWIAVTILGLVCAHMFGYAFFRTGGTFKAAVTVNAVLDITIAGTVIGYFIVRLVNSLYPKCLEDDGLKVAKKTHSALHKRFSRIMVDVETIKKDCRAVKFRMDAISSAYEDVRFQLQNNHSHDLIVEKVKELFAAIEEADASLLNGAQ